VVDGGRYFHQRKTQVRRAGKGNLPGISAGSGGGAASHHKAATRKASDAPITLLSIVPRLKVLPVVKIRATSINRGLQVGILPVCKGP